MEALEKLGKEEYLIPYLNSYLFWNPPQYESALREVKRTREKELNGKCPSIRSDDATWHLKTVLGGQKVVQLALGIYDLELAYYVITLVAEEVRLVAKGAAMRFFTGLQSNLLCYNGMCRTRANMYRSSKSGNPLKARGSKQKLTST